MKQHQGGREKLFLTGGFVLGLFFSLCFVADVSAAAPASCKSLQQEVEAARAGGQSWETFIHQALDSKQPVDRVIAIAFCGGASVKTVVSAALNAGANVESVISACLASGADATETVYAAINSGANEAAAGRAALDAGASPADVRMGMRRARPAVPRAFEEKVRLRNGTSSGTGGGARPEVSPSS